MPIPAKVIALMGKTGAKGVSRVRCKIIDESSRDKVIVRNVMGPVKVGDILMIHKADMETAGVID
ncbi:MAG: 30S ribosomal protein S28e [Candidatus Aenigmarchaeota archaeon]|nr:30S ribosomal protein S28e [Candidatus Aenigmarchaeota archaeon]MCK5474302.1 30S ribosomal protein S28e [Candidatus Aenigmarchaeota archaeon]